MQSFHALFALMMIYEYFSEWGCEYVVIVQQLLKLYKCISEGAPNLQRFPRITGSFTSAFAVSAPSISQWKLCRRKTIRQSSAAVEWSRCAVVKETLGWVCCPAFKHLWVEKGLNQVIILKQLENMTWQSFMWDMRDMKLCFVFIDSFGRWKFPTPYLGHFFLNQPIPEWWPHYPHSGIDHSELFTLWARRQRAHWSRLHC